MQLVSAGLPHHIEHVEQVQTMDGGRHLAADGPVTVRTMGDILQHVESTQRWLLCLCLNISMAGFSLQDIVLSMASVMRA